MKNIFFYLISLATLFSNAQTIEKKHTDFELVRNAKNIIEYDAGGNTKNIDIALEKMDYWPIRSDLKTRQTRKYSFNEAGFISEIQKYSINPKVMYQEVYRYDNNNLLLDITEKESALDTINFSDYAKIKLTRNGNEVTKTWTYAQEDTIHSEKFILENNYIIEEKAPNREKIRVKYTYDKNCNKLKGIIILESGEKLTWNNSYTFYPNGAIKSKKCISTDLKTKTSEIYFQNGLLKSETSQNGNLEYVYKYDNQGNWIYKKVYKNKKLNELIKREISYF